MSHQPTTHPAWSLRAFFLIAAASLRDGDVKKVLEVGVDTGEL